MVEKEFNSLMQDWKNLSPSVAKTEHRNTYHRYITGKKTEISTMLKVLYDFNRVKVSEFKIRPKGALSLNLAISEAFRGWPLFSKKMKDENREHYDLFNEKGPSAISTYRKRQILRDLGWKEGWVEPM